jgi:hypothetical protein
MQDVVDKKNRRRESFNLITPILKILVAESPNTGDENNVVPSIVQPSNDMRNGDANDLTDEPNTARPNRNVF